MKAEKKTNHLPEDADKIEQIPEEKNDGQDEPIKAKKPRKNRILARLRKTWARITGCMRSWCTCIQGERSSEELPETSGSYVEHQYSSEMNMEELPEPRSMKEELPESSWSYVELQYSSEMYMEELSEPCSMKEELPESSGSYVKLQYSSEMDIEELPESSGSYVELQYSSEMDIEELPESSGSYVELQYSSEMDIEELPESSGSYVELQYSSEMDIDELPETSGSSSEMNMEDLKMEDNKDSAEIKEENLEENHIIKTDKEAEVATNYFVETELEEDYKRLEAESHHHLDLLSQIDLGILDEFCQLFKISQSGSNLDKEPSTSDIILEKLQQPCEKSPSTVPITVDCFKVHQTLGAGTYGEVVLATDIIRKESVAIKVIDKCLFTKQEETFTELEILKLSHECPFLTHGLAAFHSEGHVFYVLELAAGGNLHDFINNNYPLDTPTIQFMIAELICGIQFLHKKNIIHRDLKPANIVRTADGHIKITDFGLALMDVYERTTEEPLSTPPYAAPEMWRRQEYGRGVDYFSIGVIMYIMYTKEFPFPNTYGGFMHSILNNTPFYPEFLTPDTVDILQGLLCKDQDYRLGEQGDIRKHPYFSNINWEDVESRRMEPPEAIKTACVVDLNVDEALNFNEGQINIKPEDQKIFKELSFVCADWSQHYHPVNNEAI